IGLLDFGKSFDPFKVKIRERTLAENEVFLLMETESRKKRKVAFNAGSFPVKKVMDSSSVAPTVQISSGGKTPTALEKLVMQSGQQDFGSRPTTAAPKDFVSSFVTPTLEHEYKDESGDNVRNSPTYVVLTSSFEPVNTDASTSLETTSYLM
ncbi:hypothetical protein Tco_1160840, partial [Tanacetum coccineum]